MADILVQVVRYHFSLYPFAVVDHGVITKSITSFYLFLFFLIVTFGSRMAWFIFMIFKLGSGYHAFKLHLVWLVDMLFARNCHDKFNFASILGFLPILNWFLSYIQTPLMVSLSIHFCQWLPHHQATGDLEFLNPMRIWALVYLVTPKSIWCYYRVHFPPFHLMWLTYWTAKLSWSLWYFEFE